VNSARSSLLVLLTALALLQGSAGSARAQEPSEYESTIKRAVTEFDLGHWEEASALFHRAHELKPNARTWRGMGLCAFELRKYVEATAHLEAALVDPHKPLTAKQRNETQKVIDQARQFVSVYRVRVRPTEAEVVVDGKRQSLRDGQLFLDPGPHTVLVRAAGYAERRESLRTDAGVRDELAIDLEVNEPLQERATPAEAAPAPPAEVAPADDSAQPAPSRRRVWTWVLGGATLASAATTVGLRIGVSRQEDDFNACTSYPGEDCSSLKRKGETLLNATYAMAAVTGALLGGSIAAFFLEGRSNAQRSVAVMIAPTGLRLRGTF
jgi:Tfp pilus assembly protein PilF